jgi:hypothetical protein
LDTALNIIGFLGALLILSAYFLQQHGAVTGHSASYLWMNLAGSSAIAVSLLWSWNMPSFILQCAWITITGQSLLRQRVKTA